MPSTISKEARAHQALLARKLKAILRNHNDYLDISANVLALEAEAYSRAELIQMASAMLRLLQNAKDRQSERAQNLMHGLNQALLTLNIIDVCSYHDSTDNCVTNIKTLCAGYSVENQRFALLYAMKKSSYPAIALYLEELYNQQAIQAIDQLVSHAADLTAENAALQIYGLPGAIEVKQAHLIHLLNKPGNTSEFIAEIQKSMRAIALFELRAQIAKALPDKIYRHAGEYDAALNKLIDMPYRKLEKIDVINELIRDKLANLAQDEYTDTNDLISVQIEWLLQAKICLLLNYDPPRRVPLHLYNDHPISEAIFNIDADGVSPLHIAAVLPSPELIASLLDDKTKQHYKLINQPDDYGCTPYEYMQCAHRAPEDHFRTFKSFAERGPVLAAIHKDAEYLAAESGIRNLIHAEAKIRDELKVLDKLKEACDQTLMAYNTEIKQAKSLVIALREKQGWGDFYQLLQNKKVQLPKEIKRLKLEALTLIGLRFISTKAKARHALLITEINMLEDSLKIVKQEIRKHEKFYSGMSLHGLTPAEKAKLIALEDVMHSQSAGKAPIESELSNIHARMAELTQEMKANAQQMLVLSDRKTERHAEITATYQEYEPGYTPKTPMIDVTAPAIDPPIKSPLTPAQLSLLSRVILAFAKKFKKDDPKKFSRRTSQDTVVSTASTDIESRRGSVVSVMNSKHALPMAPEGKTALLFRTPAVRLGLTVAAAAAAAHLGVH